MVTIGYDVIHTEAEWNDEQRQLAMRLYEHELTICNCGCGLPVDVAHDPEQIFIVDEDTCHARRAIEKVRREKHDAAVRAKKGEGWDAGLKLHARPVTLEEAKAHLAAQEEKRLTGEAGPKLAAAREAGRQHRAGRDRLGATAREKRREAGPRLAAARKTGAAHRRRIGERAES